MLYHALSHINNHLRRPSNNHPLNALFLDNPNMDCFMLS